MELKLIFGAKKKKKKEEEEEEETYRYVVQFYNSINLRVT